MKVEIVPMLKDLMWGLNEVMHIKCLEQQVVKAIWEWLINLREQSGWLDFLGEEGTPGGYVCGWGPKDQSETRRKGEKKKGREVALKQQAAPATWVNNRKKMETH